MPQPSGQVMLSCATPPTSATPCIRAVSHADCLASLMGSRAWSDNNEELAKDATLPQAPVQNQQSGLFNER